MREYVSDIINLKGKTLKLLFKYLTYSYALLENPVDNHIIMRVIGFIAFFVAYSIVGWFYGENLISSSGEGLYIKQRMIM